MTVINYPEISKISITTTKSGENEIVVTVVKRTRPTSNFDIKRKSRNADITALSFSGPISIYSVTRRMENKDFIKTLLVSHPSYGTE